MKMKYWILVLFNLTYILGFGIYYVLNQNYEFLLYVAMLVAIMVFVLLVQKKAKFPLAMLWLFSTWGLLHMAGGGINVAGDRLYSLVLFPIYDAHDPLGEFVILKFDQALHFYVYFIMTFVFIHLVKHLTYNKKFTFLMYLLVIMASMGVSVINEIIEFGASLSFETGVGGYYNTMLDLCFNTLGAVLGGLTYAVLRRRIKTI